MNLPPWTFGVAGAAVIAAFAFGDHYGRSQQPDVQVSDAVTLVQQTWGRTVYQRDEQKTRVVYREKVTKPDGTKIERESEREDSHVSEHTDSSSGSVAKTDAKRNVVVTAARPQWRVGALVGASLNSPLLPIAGPLVLGVTVERRVVGPLWAGLWAQTGGSGGLSLTLEF